MKIKSAFTAMVLGSLFLISQVNAQSSSPSTTPNDQRQNQPSGPALKGPAPDFALQSLHGETVRLSDFHGKVVLINFWATWCGPCKILTPWLVELQNEYGPRGLVIIGITLDEDATAADIAEFADEFRVNYTIVIGNEKVAKAYRGVPAMPQSVVIGRNGKVFSELIGLKSKGEIEDSIKKALDTPTEGSEAEGTAGPSAQSQK